MVTRLRIMGGPFPKQERCSVDMDPEKTAFGDIFRLVQEQWATHPQNISQDVVVSTTTFQLVELEESGQGSSGRPLMRVVGPLPLEQTLQTHPLVVPLLMLKPIQPAVATTAASGVQHRKSVSFHDAAHAGKARVIGGPILSSDRVFVEDKVDPGHRSSVMLVNDLFTQIAAHLPQSVHPPIHCDHYELYEAVVTNPATGACEASTMLQPLEPARLHTLRHPLLMLKAKPAPDAHPATVSNNSPTVLAGSTSAMWSPARRSSVEVTNSSFGRQPSLFSTSFGEMTSSMFVKSPEAKPLADTAQPSTSQAPQGIALATNASPKSEASVSPSRRSSSFFRTVANAMLGTRRASSLLGEEEEIDETSVTFASSTATTTAASGTAMSSSTTPSPARSSLTAASPVRLPGDVMASNTFLHSVTFTLTLHFMKRVSHHAQSVFAAESWLSTPQQAHVAPGLTKERVVPVIVTPHMSLEAIASVATTQLGSTVSLAGAQWFRSEADMLQQTSTPLLLDETPMSLKLVEPTLVVVMPGSEGVEGTLEEGLSVVFAHEATLLGSDGEEGVTAPLAAKRRASSVRLTATTHTTIRSITTLSEAFLPPLSHNDAVVLHRRLEGVLRRKDTPLGGPEFMELLVRAWQRAFHPAQLDPDATDRRRAAMERHARKVIASLCGDAVVAASASDAFLASNVTSKSTEGEIRLRTICHVAESLSARQVLQSDLIHAAYRQEPVARQIVTVEHASATQRLHLEFVCSSETRTRHAIERQFLESKEHARRVGLAARAYSALMSRASSIFALWQHLSEDKARWSLAFAELEARQVVGRRDILAEEHSMGSAILDEGRRVGAALGQEHFIQCTQVAHFTEEASQRAAIEQECAYTMGSSVLYFQQFCNRKAILAQNEVWFGALDLLSDRLDVEQYDLIPSSVGPFYRLAWGQRYDLLLAQESSRRLHIRQQSESLYGSICRQFSEWIEERNALHDQLSRMELSKVERIARVRIQDQQTMDMETLHYIIQDSFLYHWERHQERLAVCKKETIKRERWEHINYKLRDVWYQMHHVLSQEVAEYRHMTKSEHSRAEYFAFLKAEISQRVIMLEEEWEERVSLQKLYMQVAFQQQRALARILLVSNRILLEDDEELSRRDIVDDAFDPYPCWSQCLVASHGEATYRSLIKAEESSASARFYLLDSEVRHRRGLEHVHHVTLGNWKEQFRSGELELRIANEQHHFRNQVQTFSLLVRISPLYVPSGAVTINVSRAATADAVLSAVRAVVPPTKHYNFDKENFSIVTHGATNVLLPRDVVWPSLATDKNTKKSVDLMSNEQVSAVSVKLSHRAVVRAVSPVLSQTSEPSGDITPPAPSITAGKPKSVQPLGPAAPTLPQHAVKQRTSPPLKSKPTPAAMVPRVRSPPRKAALPEEARRKSTLRSETSAPEFDAEDPGNTKFTFRLYFPGVSSGHMPVTLTASSAFSALLPFIQQLRPDVQRFDDILVFPAVVLAGRVTPSGKAVSELDTIQRSGLFGGGLLVLRKNRPTQHQQQQQQQYQPRVAVEAMVTYPGVVPAQPRDEEEYIPLLPNAQRWHVEDELLVVSPHDNDLGDREAPLSMSALVNEHQLEPTVVPAAATTQSKSKHVDRLPVTVPREAVEAPSHARPLISVASSSAVSSAYASPRAAVNASQTSSSMTSLPALSASPVPFRFERPATPDVDSPHFGGVAYPTLQSFGITDDTPRGALPTVSHLGGVTPGPPPQTPASEAHVHRVTAHVSSVAATVDRATDVLAEKDTAATTLCATAETSVKRTVSPVADTSGVMEPPDQRPAVVEPVNAPDSPRPVKIVEVDTDDRRNVVPPSAVTTDDTPLPTLATPVAAPLTDTADHAAVTTQTNVICTVFGGPISSASPLKVSIAITASSEQLLDHVSELLHLDTAQREQWMLCEVVLSAPGNASSKPALRPCRAGSVVTDCASRTFALRAKATKRLELSTSNRAFAEAPSVPRTNTEAVEASVAASTPVVVTSPHAETVATSTPGAADVRPLSERRSVSPLQVSVSPSTAPLLPAVTVSPHRDVGSVALPAVSPKSIMISSPAVRSVSPARERQVSPLRAVVITPAATPQVRVISPKARSVSPAQARLSPTLPTFPSAIAQRQVSPGPQPLAPTAISRSISPAGSTLDPFIVLASRKSPPTDILVHVRLVVSGHHLLLEDISMSSTVQDLFAPATEFLQQFHLPAHTHRSVVVKDGVMQLSSGQSRIMSRSDTISSLAPLDPANHQSPRIVVFEKRQTVFSGGAVDELFDVSDLPHCSIIVRHSDDGPAMMNNGLLLRPSMDTAFRSVMKLVLEERGGERAYDMRLAKVYIRQHASLEELFALGTATVTMQRLLTSSVHSESHGAVVLVDDLDESPMTYFDLPANVPAFQSLFVILPAPKVHVVETVAPVVAPVPATSASPARRQSLFDRLRTAIMGSPTTETAQQPPQQGATHDENVIGFDYGRSGADAIAATGSHDQHTASPKRADPIALRVLGGPIPADMKLVVSMMSSELVASIFAHCRNRLIEFGAAELALQCSPEHFTVHYVRRQLGQQRATADKDAMRVDASLHDCGIEKSSHVVTLRKVAPKLGDVVLDAMQASNLAVSDATKEVKRVRIVGGPISKQARVYIALPSATLPYRDWFPLIDAAVAAAVSPAPSEPILPDSFVLVEMEVPDGGAARQRREIALDDTFAMSPMFSLLVALKKRKPLTPPPPAQVINVGDALDLVEVLPFTSPNASPTKSVRWDDQSPKAQDNRTIRVRVIAAVIPPKVKVFVTLGAWMSFGSVFRLVAEQLTSHGLAFPGDQFSEDYYGITAMKLDGLSQLLVPDKKISPLDEVRDALDVKVLMLALTSSDESEAAPVAPRVVSPPPLLTRSSSFSTSSISAPPAAVQLPSSLRTSRVVPIRIVGISGVPSSCKIVIHAAMSARVSQLFSLIVDAVRNAEGVDKNAVRYFDCHPKTHQLVEVEVAENGTHRTKQTLDLQSTLFLCDFAAPMSLIRVEALRKLPPTDSPFGQDEHADLSGSVDVFTPKRTQERQHRRASLDTYHLPEAIRVSAASPQSLRGDPLSLDAVVLEQPSDADLQPQASDPFAIDINTERLDALSSGLVRKGSGVWEKPSPEVTPRASPALQQQQRLPASRVDTLPSPTRSVNGDEHLTNRAALEDVVQQTVVDMPLSIPSALNGDDTEFEGMHVEEVMSDEDDEQVFSYEPTGASAHVDSHRQGKVDSPMSTPTPQKASTSTPSSSTTSQLPVMSSSGTSHHRQPRFDDDVDVMNVSSTEGGDRYTEASPKHNSFHTRAVGSPYNSFRKHRLGAGGLDGSFDSSPRRTGSRENKFRNDVVEITPLATLDPMVAKPRSPDVLLMDDDEDSIRLFQTNLASRNNRKDAKSAPRGSLAGAHDLEEHRRTLAKIERDLQAHSLPQLRGVGASKTPMVSGPTQALAQQHLKRQRGRSVEANTQESPFLPPLSRSMDFGGPASLQASDRYARSRN